jgi:hypothetical protein
MKAAVLVGLAGVAVCACGSSGSVPHAGAAQRDADVPDTADAQQPCLIRCPAAWVFASIAVTTAPTTVVEGVQAMLAGPVEGHMNCTPNPPGRSVVCAWPTGVEVVPGAYSLRVSAPGYETATVQVMVTYSPPQSCGCAVDSIAPSIISLVPVDAGVDGL